MNDSARHSVEPELIAAALEDVDGRAHKRWNELRYLNLSLGSLRSLGNELLDHVGACSLQDPELSDAHTRLVLRSAAECAVGVLDLGAFPNGDFTVPFPLADSILDSDDYSLHDDFEEAPTARTWLDAFALCLTSGMIREHRRALGVMFGGSWAEEIHSGVPLSIHLSRSYPADLAEMDTLRLYLTAATGHLPSDWPTVVLRKPGNEELAAAARRLDEHELTADQVLLRALVDDDQATFEEALTGHLARYRAHHTSTAVAPRTLLPFTTIAVAALAVQVHGWQLHVRSEYLPAVLLHAPEHDALR